jgi:hypothetical protein
MATFGSLVMVGSLSLLTREYVEIAKKLLNSGAFKARWKKLWHGDCPLEISVESPGFSSQSADSACI